MVVVAVHNLKVSVTERIANGQMEFAKVIEVKKVHPITYKQGSDRTELKSSVQFKSSLFR